MSAARWASPIAVVVALLVGAAPGASAEPTPAGRTYQPPTDGAVLDPFRPPPQPWLAGNRGIEYRTDPGSVLVAIGPGVVAFAGPVAGRLVVSIVHPDGLRSSLTGVAAVSVAVGATVLAGAPVAIAAERVHLGVRRGDAYLDPATLWGTVAGGGHVRLVPRSGPPPSPSPSPSSSPSPRGTSVVRRSLVGSIAMLAW